MAENKDIQIPVKKIPTFSVLKNNSILKTIVLLRKPSSSIQKHSDEEILLVGRHPHCNITLEHPSISRYHLRIHSNPSEQILSVIDLSSVHGTWVSGKRIEPGVLVNLKEGDNVKMGGSSRVYELHWVPLTQAFDVVDQFVPSVYSIKEGDEETNQDEKPEAHSSDDGLECLNLLSSDEIRSSPLNRKNPLTSSCDHTEVEHLSPSKTDSENGEIFSTVLGQPPIVSETRSAVKDSGTLSESENLENCSRDNMSDEAEPQNHVDIKDDLPVPNCSKSSSDDTEVEHSSPSKTGQENGEISTTVEAISESEDLASDEFEPQNSGIIKDVPFAVPNFSNSSCDDTEAEHLSPSETGHGNGDIFTTTETILESEDLSSNPQNHAIIKDGPFSVPNCSNSSGDDTEAEHSSPSETGHENGEIFTTTEGIPESEDLSNSLRDNMSDEFELQNHGVIKDIPFSVPNCSNSSCDDAEVKHSSPSQTVHENGKIVTTTEAMPESEDLSNWLRDNMSDEFEQLGYGTMKDGLVSVPNCSNSSCDDTEVEHSNPSQTGHENGKISTTTEAISELEDLSNWLWDNMIDEFDQLDHRTMKDDLVSVLNCSNSSYDDTEVEHSSPLKTGYEIGENLTIKEAISESEDQCNWLRDNMNNELEQFSHGTMEDGLVSVRNCSNSSCDDTEVEHSSPLKTSHEIGENLTITEAISELEDLSNWLWDNMIDEFDQLDHRTMKDDLVSVALLDVTETHEKDALYQDIATGNEVQMCSGNEPVNQQKIDPGSVPVAHFNGVNRDEDMSCMPDKAGDEEISLVVEFEQMDQAKLMDEFSYVAPLDAVDRKVENDHDIKENESVFVALPDGTNMDQEQDFTPDVELYMNLKAMKKASVSTTLFNRSDGSDLEIFSPNKENKDPNACSAKSLKKRWLENEKFENKQSNHHTKSKKQWTMIVDTNSLLHIKSFEDLKLLQGLKGTQLYIPKIVIRELKNVKRQNDLLSKSMKKASLALKWIDECMVNTRWWIHMDDEILHSSESESNVLRTALHLRKEITDGKIIILSNDLTLKIKAMAEGVMCEAAGEFRRSLVNPFSERFMWAGSSPRGPTWSCVDDDVLRQKYHGSGLNASHGLEGLKLLARITSFR